MTFYVTHKLVCDGCDAVLYERDHHMTGTYQPEPERSAFSFRNGSNEWSLCYGCGDVLLGAFKGLFLNKPSMKDRA